MERAPFQAPSTSFLQVCKGWEGWRADAWGLDELLASRAFAGGLGRGFVQAGQPWGPTVGTGEVPEATHCSATMYCSGRGVHCTPATCTPWAISEKSRPRFTPRMVTLVPPSGGPDTVRI